MINNLAGDLLELWEKGLGCSQSERALILLNGFSHSSPRSDFMSLPLGERDEHLMRVRTKLFGPEVQSVTTCPKCRESIEHKFSILDICGTHVTTPNDSLILQVKDWVIQFRCPTTRDLLGFEHGATPQMARQLILEKCIERAEKNSEQVPVDRIPKEVIESIEQHMEENDPHADRQISVQCPTCHHVYTVDFDITSFFWKEVERYALILLRKVHILATAYGWSEREILTMSPARRDMYLELVEG